MVITWPMDCATLGQQQLLARILTQPMHRAHQIILLSPFRKTRRSHACRSGTTRGARTPDFANATNCLCLHEAILTNLSRWVVP